MATTLTTAAARGAAAAAAASEIHRLRVYRYYLPVFFWVQQQLTQHKHKFQGKDTPPLVVSRPPAYKPCT